MKDLATEEMTTITHKTETSLPARRLIFPNEERFEDTDEDVLKDAIQRGNNRTENVIPRVMNNIDKAQHKQQRDYEKKRTKARNPKSHPKNNVAEDSNLSPGDYVTIKPMGRPPKVMKEAVLFRVVRVGDKEHTNYALIEDNSDPPNKWWEPFNQLCIAFRASECEVQTEPNHQLNLEENHVSGRNNENDENNENNGNNENVENNGNNENNENNEA